MKAHFNLEPEQSDDESSSLDDIIDQHVQDQEHTFIDDGGRVLVHEALQQSIMVCRFAMVRDN